MGFIDQSGNFSLESTLSSLDAIKKQETPEIEEHLRGLATLLSDDTIKKVIQTTMTEKMFLDLQKVLNILKDKVTSDGCKVIKRILKDLLTLYYK